MLKIISFLILIFSYNCMTNRVCLDPSGKEVDWYTIFFFSKSMSKIDKEIHYAYFDPNLNELQYYKYDENTFPPTRITKYVTEGGEDFNYFFWNDDKTVKNGSNSSASSTKAHAKGSLVYDSAKGAFLLHSLPQYPTRTKENEVLNELPKNAGSYAQNFLCISVNKNTAEIIAKLINCVNVSINKSVPNDRVNSSPNIWVQSLINNRMNSTCKEGDVNKIKSIGGVEFTFYGKNYKNKIIPYDTTMRQAYEDHFYVRTWSRPALAPPLNDTYNLVNVINVTFGQYSFDVNQEHSKWALAYSKNVVCFADLNHCESQKERGGNIVCFENKKLHDIMKSAITATDAEIYSKSSILNISIIVLLLFLLMI